MAHPRLLAALLLAALAGAVLLWTRVADRPADDGAPAAPGPYAADGSPVGGLPPARGPAGAPGPNLVLLVIDSLRADAAEPRPGGAPVHMPFLASLGASGTRFPAACAPAPWTKPSVATLLTGLLPGDHGEVDLRDPPRLPQAVVTFAEVLSRAYGYETAAFVDSTWYGDTETVLQGFGHTRPFFALQATEPLLSAWARSRDPRRPFFLLLHTLEAHDPYGARNHPWPSAGEWARTSAALDRALAVREPWEMARALFLDLDLRLALRQRNAALMARTVTEYLREGYAKEPRPALLAEIREAYEEGTRWVDGNLRRTVDLLRAWGLLEGTLLVVTADHGESFAEHGQLGHGGHLYDELLRIPLVMTGLPPFDGGRTVEASVGLVDVLPTFLDLVGCPPVPASRGRSLRPLLAPDAASDGWPVLAEESYVRNAPSGDTLLLLKSARTRRWKYVVTYEVLGDRLEEELYDLVADPGERSDRLPPGPVALGDLPPEIREAAGAVRARFPDLPALARRPGFGRPPGAPVAAGR